MTVVSVTQAANRLGIDAKTLRRWLTDAQLPLHRHPHDGRKQGVSSEHLHVLARLHQRRLLPPAGEDPLLPAALLALPEQISALHAQIAALEQQVAALTRLLQQHQQEPTLSAAPSQQSRRSKRPTRPASPAPRVRPAASGTAKAPRKPVHVIPRVEYSEQGHYVVICPTKGLLPIRPDTPEWFTWVREQSSFRFVGRAGHFSAHHEWRTPRGAWRAHRHIRNHVYIQRLAPSQELTLAVLEHAAEALQTHLK